MNKATYPFLINGKIIECSKAILPLNSVTFKYAASVFEGIRGYWREDENSMAIFALEEHLERLFQSIKLMRMDYDFTKDQLKDWIWNLIDHNQFKEDIYIRCACSISGPGAINTRGPTMLSVHAFPYARKLKNTEEGIHVCVSSWQRISDIAMPARIKCISNYQNGRLATLQAEEDGYDLTTRHF
ncbi:MAG: aminotransferase class IV [Proteobacteria bacterium]|nr:aminotransferase class IV [Pseudomonadota bacterium]